MEDNNASPEVTARLNRVLAQHPIERWSDFLNAVCRIPVAREFLVISKWHDIPLHSQAMMGHETLHLDNARQGKHCVINDYKTSNNPVTWALLFGWVPDCLKEK